MQGGAISYQNGLVATVDCNLTSPWYNTLNPVKVISGQVDNKDSVLQIRYSENDNWTNLSTGSFTSSNGNTITQYQLRFIHNGSMSTSWEGQITLLAGKWR